MLSGYTEHALLRLSLMAWCKISLWHLLIDTQFILPVSIQAHLICCYLFIYLRHIVIYLFYLVVVTIYLF